MNWDYCVGVGLVSGGLVIFPPPAVAFVIFPPAVMLPPVALPDMFCALTEAIPAARTKAAERETIAAKIPIAKNICFRINLCSFLIGKHNLKRVQLHHYANMFPDEY